MPSYVGAYWDFDTGWFTNPYAWPAIYLDLDVEPMYGYLESRLREQKAWDFIIEQVHKYLGEVTIMAVGAAANVAIALYKDPTFAEDAAEVNWFYDPDAIKRCLCANWNSQIVVPDDLSRQVYMEASIYERLLAEEVNPITELIFVNENNFDPSITHYVWDEVVLAIYLKPDIMKDLQTRYLTVDDNPGINYKRAVRWVKHDFNDPETGEGMPEGVKPVQILMEIEAEAFWNFYVEILTGEMGVYKEPPRPIAS